MLSLEQIIEQVKNNPEKKRVKLLIETTAKTRNTFNEICKTANITQSQAIEAFNLFYIQGDEHATL